MCCRILKAFRGTKINVIRKSPTKNRYNIERENTFFIFLLFLNKMKYIYICIGQNDFVQYLHKTCYTVRLIAAILSKLKILYLRYFQYTCTIIILLLEKIIFSLC